MKTAEDIFRSSDLVARGFLGWSPKCCVVTFDSYTDVRTLERSGFGEAFFLDCRIDAIHIISRDNDWYQNPEIPSLLCAVAKRTMHYDRVLAYGSSMGAYAALRLGKACGAKTALALSPQFSIDPARASFETRWLAEAARIARFPLERQNNRGLIEKAYIAFDPYDIDRRHVELYKAVMPVVELRAPHAGHPVTGFLAETGILKNLVRGMITGDIDPKSFQDEARRARKSAPQYLSVLSKRIRSKATKVALARRAAEMAPGDLVYMTNYATALSESGNFEEAQNIFQDCLDLHPDNPVALYLMSEMFERNDDLQRAIERMIYLIDRHPDAKVYRARLNYLRDRLHNSSAATPPISAKGSKK